MFDQIKKLGLSFTVAMLIVCIGLGMDPTQTSHATPTPAEISARITALTGLQPEEIDAMYAAEQRPDVVLIAYEITIPIVLEPRTGYLLVRIAATQEWIRVLIDQTEWRNDFRPYLEAQGITIHEQPVGTIDQLTASQEAADIAAISPISGEATANIVLYNSPAGPGGSPAPVPQRHFEPDPGPSATSDQIGTTEGEFRVDESGAATYSIPIAAPAGTAGVAPEVTLNYSSSGSNGIAGFGWSIGGLSAISRCRSTLGQDNVAEPITWTNSDRFCLDGQRLILTSGSHGAAGATYRAEIDNGTLVTVVDSASGGPDYFKVQRRDGSTSYYGTSPDSTDTSAKLNNASGETLTWAIRHFTDSAGNPIWFDYETTASAQRIKNIKYAYGVNRTNPGAAHGARINFGYETRQDVISGYVAGHHFANDQRLSSINVYNTITSEQAVRQYNLAYGEGQPVATDSLSRLTSVQECIGATCLPKTTFRWHLPGLSSQYIATSGFTMANNNHGLRAHRPADIDGDGKIDLVWIEAVYDGSNMQPRLNYAISDGIDFAQQTFAGSSADICPASGQKEVCLGTTAATFSVKLETFDFNADGRSDVAAYDYAAGIWKIYLSEPQGDGSWKLSGIPVSAPTADGNLTGRGTSFIDVNSDGLVDAVTIAGIADIKVRYLEVDPTQLVESSRYYRFGPEEFLNPDAPLGSSQGGWPPIYSDLEIRSSNTDFNGDGRVDFLLTGKITTECHVENPNPNQCPPDANLNLAVVITGPNSVAKYAEFPYTIPRERIQTVDINADGLADVVYPRTNNSFFYRLNLGDGTFGSPVAFSESTLGQNPQYNNAGPDEPQFTDWNLDGYPDLVWKLTENSTTTVLARTQIRYWNPGTGSYDPASTTPAMPMAQKSKKEWVMFADMTGNGRPDMVRFNMDAQGEVTVVKPLILPDTSPPGPRAPNRIGIITSGLGATTQASYEPLSNTLHYERLNVDSATATGQFCESEPGITYCYPVPITVAQPASFYAALNGDWDLPAGTQTLGKYRPVLELNGPLYVVTRVEGDAPTAGALPGDVDAAAKSAISYYYGEAKLQASGRGMLGFERLKTVDEQTGVQTVTFYRQDWPFIGYPRKTEVRSAGGYLLSQSISDWAFLEYTSGSRATAETQGTAALGPVHTVLTTSTERSYDLVNDGASQGNLISETITSTSHDAEANPDIITVINKNGSGAEVKRVNTDNDYYDAPQLPLREARLSQTTVTTTYEGQVWPARVSSFSYYTAGTTRGLLETEIIEPTKPEYTLTTTHSYDQFGNRVRSSTQGGAETRCNVDTVAYDARGRYVDDTYDCLGRKLTEVTTRNKFGSPTQSKTFVDASGSAVYTDISYGALGREYFRRLPDGSFVTTYLTGNMANCPAGTVYKAQVTTGGGAAREECYDKLARPTRTLTQGFDGAWDAQDTEYDALGRIVFKSEPYDLSPNPGPWTRLYYDKLGRVTMTVLPDGSDATTTYDGLSTIYTNDLGHTKTEVRNVLGEITDVYDNLGGHTEYWYDYQGNLRRTEDNANNPTEIKYDLLGRKKETNDPNKGVWTYGYNYFGELTLQVNANGHTSIMDYDGLGRMKTRVDTCASASSGNCTGGTLTEGSTEWIYDTAAHGLGQLASVNDSVSGYTRAVTYDSLGRPFEVTTNFDGGVYFEKTTYDQFGRVFQVFDAAGDGSFQDSGVQHTYNAAGYLETIGDAVLVNGTPRTVYRQITAMNARGQVTGEVLGNGIVTTSQYSPTTGRITNISSNGPGGEVQDLRYDWDTVGNLKHRHEYSGSKTLEETFAYDGLNRLRSQQVVGQAAITVTYDTQHLGNIASKSDVGTYGYGDGSAGPNAVTSAGGATYTYDANGNNVSGDGRTIKYTTFDKPYEIAKNGHTVEFAYGPDRSRYRRTDTGAEGTTTTRYIGNVEIIDRPNNIRERKRHIAGIVVDTSFYNSGGTFIDHQTHYLHKDHLGSLDVMTSASGYIVSEFSFDAWGQRRDASDWTALLHSQLVNFDHSITTRGFTGHEMLDEVGVIHMNGRIYNQKLGRFLQADPVVQDPMNSQSLNRYSYVWNNPLNATDPSGFFVSLLVGAILTFVPEITIGIAAAWMGAAAFAETLIAGGNFFDALVSGLSGAAFTWLGAKFAGTFGFNWKSVGTVAIFGALGGVTSVLQGGKFGHGFRSAGISTIVSGTAGRISNSIERRIGKLIVSTVAGGTASELTGGKFANGAVYASFSYAVSNVKRTGRASAVQTRRNSSGGSRLGNTLRKLPFAGFALGPIGDIVSGRVGYGVSSLVMTLTADLAATLVGVVGKVYVTATDIFKLGRPLFTLDLKGFGVNFAKSIHHLVVPTYGLYGGAGWGGDQDDIWGQRTPLNAVDASSQTHDDDGNDWGWVARNWRSTNGPVGSLYTLLGTVPFIAADCIRGDCSPQNRTN